MAIEDVFNGAKTALMFYDAFSSAVVKEIGMERAAALQAKVSDNMGDNLWILARPYFYNILSASWCRSLYVFIWVK